MESLLLIINKLPTAFLWIYALVITALAAFIFFRKSTATADSATIASLNRQLQTQGAEMESMDGKIKQFELNFITLTKLLGEKDGIISTKNDQLQQYEKIFQNRDPELLKVLGNISNFMKSLDGRVGTMYKESQATHRAVRQELKLQTTILQKTERRNTDIDKAHGQAVSG